jgi:hypothetical protein
MENLYYLRSTEYCTEHSVHCDDIIMNVQKALRIAWQKKEIIRRTSQIRCGEAIHIRPQESGERNLPTTIDGNIGLPRHACPWFIIDKPW